MSKWYDTTQGATKALAEANGLPWEGDDIDMVIAFTDVTTDEEIAYATGRTLASIWAIQHRVRTEGVDPVRRAYARRADAPAPPTCPTHHIALTATGDCDWC